MANDKLWYVVVRDVETEETNRFIAVGSTLEQVMDMCGDHVSTVEECEELNVDHITNDHDGLALLCGV
jgi:hypothetical protein